KMQQDKYLADQNFALEREKLKVEMAKSKDDLSKARIDAKTKVSPDVALSDGELNEGQAPVMMMMQQLSEGIMMGLQQIASMQSQNSQQIIQAIQNPPARQVIRDQQGKIAGVQ